MSRASRTVQPFLRLAHPFPILIYNAVDCWLLNASRKVILCFVGLNKSHHLVRGAETCADRVGTDGAQQRFSLSV